MKGFSKLCFQTMFSKKKKKKFILEEFNVDSKVHHNVVGQHLTVYLFYFQYSIQFRYSKLSQFWLSLQFAQIIQEYSINVSA